MEINDLRELPVKIDQKQDIGGCQTSPLASDLVPKVSKNIAPERF